MHEPPFYKALLQEELARRCERNPRYSLRAFAKAMAVDAAAVSRILSDKLCPSPKLAVKMMSALGLSPEERARFVDSIEDKQRARQRDRIGLGAEPVPFRPPREIGSDAFAVIASWYHYAILELTHVRSFKPDARWIASRLGISPAEAKVALDRLLKLGLLERAGRTLKKTDATLTTADKSLSTPALRKRQRQILEKAITSLENDPIERRNHSAVTMAIDPAKIPEAKRRIQTFTRELCRYLESGDRVEVYELSMSLFPVQKRSKEK